MRSVSKVITVLIASESSQRLLSAANKEQIQSTDQGQLLPIARTYSREMPNKRNIKYSEATLATWSRDNQICKLDFSYNNNDSNKSKTNYVICQQHLQRFDALYSMIFFFQILFAGNIFQRNLVQGLPATEFTWKFSVAIIHTSGVFQVFVTIVLIGKYFTTLIAFISFISL